MKASSVARHPALLLLKAKLRESLGSHWNPRDLPSLVIGCFNRCHRTPDPRICVKNFYYTGSPFSLEGPTPIRIVNKNLPGGLGLGSQACGYLAFSMVAMIIVLIAIIEGIRVRSIPPMSHEPQSTHPRAAT